MKAKIKFPIITVGRDNFTFNPKIEHYQQEGEIEFELDETYWRNEFVKAAIMSLTARTGEILDTALLARDCFKIADAMIAESKKRNKVIEDRSHEIKFNDGLDD